jgi:hypothetical protein
MPVLSDSQVDELARKVLDELKKHSLSFLLFGEPANDEERKILEEYEKAKKQEMID